MDLYNKLLQINTIPLSYPFNNKIKDNVEFTKKQLDLYYIKKYDKCIIDKNTKKGGDTSSIIVFL